MNMNRVNFNYTAVYIIIVSLVSSSLSENRADKNCQLIREDGEEFSVSDWEKGVVLPTIEDTTKPGTIIVKYKYKNIDSIDFRSSSVKYYLYAYYDDDYFFIMLMDKFAEYEEYETSTELKFKIKFGCSNRENRDIEFTLNVKDTNNHAPEFLNAPYKFNLPMSIPKGFSFELSGRIVARDIDLTNENVTFTFKKDDVNTKGFSIASNGKEEKNYPAKFIATETLDLENDITLVVYATDSGEPPLTSNTTITITVDKEHSAPRFSRALYTADLRNKSHNGVNEIIVNFSQGVITLERGYDGVRAFEISGVPEEHKEHLILTHSGILQRKNNIELQLKLIDLTEKFLSQRVLSLILTAVKDTSKAETAFQILLPEVNNNIATEKPKSEEKSVPENDSTDVYMIATTVLSLIVVGLLGGVIFIYLLMERNRT